MVLLNNENGSSREFRQELKLQYYMYTCLSCSLSQEGRAECEAIDLNVATEPWRVVRPEHLCLGSILSPGEVKGYRNIMSDEAPRKN